MTTETIRSTIALELLTTPVRRWTPYPDGLTVSGQVYTFAEFEVDEIGETSDGSLVAVRINILNVQNIAMPLITDAASMKKAVTLRRVKFDANWNQISADIFFEGRTGKPSIAGSYISLECTATLGRTGLSPVKQWSSVMHSHTPPAAGTKIPWFTSVTR